MTQTTTMVLEGIQENPQGKKSAADERLENYQRAINRILRGPVDAEIDPQDWYRIKETQSLLQVRLEEMGIRLVVIDTDRVCYLTNLNQGDGQEESFSPFRPSTLSRQASILVLLLLQRYLQSEAEIDKRLRIFTVDEMASALLVYEDTTAVDITTQMQKKTKQQLKTLEDLKLIRSNESTKLRNEDLLYEVRPLIKYFADQHRINDLRQALENYLRTGTKANKADADDPDSAQNPGDQEDQQNALDF